MQQSARLNSKTSSTLARLRRGIGSGIGRGIHRGIRRTRIAGAALVAIGAYSAALLMLKLQISFWLAAPLAMVITSLIGALVALPALRLSTWYFALISLTFASVVGELIVEWKSIVGAWDELAELYRAEEYARLSERLRVMRKGGE